MSKPNMRRKRVAPTPQELQAHASRLELVLSNLIGAPLPAPDAAGLLRLLAPSTPTSTVPPKALIMVQDETGAYTSRVEAF